MSALIEELWIIDSQGNNHYSECVGKSINKEMFPSIIISVNQLAMKMADTTIDKFTISGAKYRVCLCDQSEFIVICRISANADEKKADSYIENIRERLEKKIFKMDNSSSPKKCEDIDFSKVKHIVSLKKDKENYLGINLDKKVSRNILNKL